MSSENVIESWLNTACTYVVWSHRVGHDRRLKITSGRTVEMQRYVLIEAGYMAFYV